MHFRRLSCGVVISVAFRAAVFRCIYHDQDVRGDWIVLGSAVRTISVKSPLMSFEPWNFDLVGVC